MVKCRQLLHLALHSLIKALISSNADENEIHLVLNVQRSTMYTRHYTISTNILCLNCIQQFRINNNTNNTNTKCLAYSG